jgi:hypothetical protein
MPLRHAPRKADCERALQSGRSVPFQPFETKQSKSERQDMAPLNSNHGSYVPELLAGGPTDFSCECFKLLNCNHSSFLAEHLFASDALRPSILSNGVFAWQACGHDRLIDAGRERYSDPSNKPPRCVEAPGRLTRRDVDNYRILLTCIGH